MALHGLVIMDDDFNEIRFENSLAFNRVVEDLKYLNHEQLINLQLIIGEKLNATKESNTL